MRPRGYSHIGLGTLDLDRTRAFYERVLGFPAVRCDIIEIKEGGEIRHAFFDVGHGQLIAFMEARLGDAPLEFDAGISHGLGLPDGIYHFAFEAGSEHDLEKTRAALLRHGVPVTPIVDHEWAKSIYFKDPNGILLEYCCVLRTLGEDDARMQVRETISLLAGSPLTDFRTV